MMAKSLMLSLLLVLYSNSPADSVDQCSTGQHQSPIAIIESDDISITPVNLIFKGYDDEIQWIREDDDHTLLIAPNQIGDEVGFGGGPLNDFYKFFKLHFHWESEHTLNGLRYPSEIHFVHYNSKYDNMTEAADKPDGLAVIGLLLSIIEDSSGPDTSEFIDTLIESKSGEFSLNSLLGNSKMTWFYYLGSLTTPPCSENVQWIVIKKPSFIKVPTLEKLNRLEDGNGSVIHANARPLQPLNNRTIFYSSASTSKTLLSVFFTFTFLSIILNT